MKRIIPIVIVLIVIGSGYWWYSRSTAAALEPTVPTALVGSGTIEAETVAITAELGGRVVELTVEEGDEVSAGQILVELDKAELLAQRAQLEAALSTARANLELVSAPPRQEEIAAAQSMLNQAQVARDGAKVTWQRYQELVNNPRELETQISQAQSRVTEMERNLEMAQVNLKRAEIEAEAASRNQSDHDALVQNEAAQYRRQAAQIGVKMAEVALSGARQQVDHLIRLRNRPLQLIAQANAARATYQQTEAAILAARANLASVQAGATREDIAVAQAQVLEAAANLKAVEVQLAKQTLVSPRRGLISQKLINPGELAAPGTVLLEVSTTDTVDLTVYIPETQIGRVQIGQPARIYVDAYDDKIFEGLVSFIAHEAEFTPRNVQTEEERVNLVFAVKITMDNPEYLLKPGMPADAEILSGAEPQMVQVQTPAPTATVAQATPTPTELAAFVPTNTPTPPAGTTEPTPTSTVTPTATKKQAEVVAWALKVREGPGIDYPVVTILSQGDTVPVTTVDPDTGWLYVQPASGEKAGWISGKADYVIIK